MTKYLIDTQPKIATCTRCGEYVFACHASGDRVAVDIRPLTVEAYRDAIMAGLKTYDQIEHAGRPHKLMPRTTDSGWPPYKGRKVLADHACGTRSMNTKVVETTELPPYQARAQSTDVVRASDAMSTVVTPVTHHHSDKPDHVNAVCGNCKRMIGRDWDIVGVKVAGRWKWVQHDYDCKSENRGITARGKRPSTEKPLEANTQCACGARVFTLSGVTVDVTPVEDETGLNTYSRFNGKLKCRTDTWRHASVSYGEGYKYPGWPQHEPFCLAYKEHKCQSSSD